jgi:6-phosphogluconate dehydrogenase
VHGKEHGYSLMIGGDKNIYEKLLPLWRALAAPDGFGYVGKSGSGHFVKMVHNGIEYGLMQAYGEGFELLRNGPFKELDLAEITRIWQSGSIIRSWLLQLSHEILKKDQLLEKVSGKVAESGMGKWTVQIAQQLNVSVPVIEKSLEVRAQSRKMGGSFATKVVALLRNAFGGHEYERK